MSKQIVDHRSQYNEEPFWLDNAFLGMPSYQVLVEYPFDLLDKLDQLIRFLPRPADYLFVYLVSFFLLLLSMKVKSEYAFIGAIAFAFSTYLIIILGVGHNTKALAIGYAPLVLAGLFKILDKKYLAGFIIGALGLGLQINANHYQMTYYFLMLVGLITIINVFDDFFKKKIKDGLNKIGIVFGPERSGLDNNKIALCDYVLKINTNKKFSSLNLAVIFFLSLYMCVSTVCVSASDE